MKFKKMIVALVLINSFAVSAKVNFIETMIETYPSVIGSKLLDCTTCHSINKWQRNHYGLDLQNYLRSNYEGELVQEIVYSRAFINEGMRAIENLDSDGDGFTNLEEFEAQTFPGIAEGEEYY
jgi:hypothetical protein